MTENIGWKKSNQNAAAQEEQTTHRTWGPQGRFAAMLA